MGWAGEERLGFWGWGCREGVARGFGGDLSREIGVGVSKRNEVMFGVGLISGLWDWGRVGL